MTPATAGTSVSKSHHEPNASGVPSINLRVRHRSQHPVGDADQSWTQGIEGGSGVLVGHRSPQAAWRCSTGCTARKPTWIRFQPLIGTITKVSITCSSSVKCAAMIHKHYRAHGSLAKASKPRSRPAQLAVAVESQPRFWPSYMCHVSHVSALAAQRDVE